MLIYPNDHTKYRAFPLKVFILAVSNECGDHMEMSQSDKSSLCFGYSVYYQYMFPLIESILLLEKSKELIKILLHVKKIKEDEKQFFT